MEKKGDHLFRGFFFIGARDAAITGNDLAISLETNVYLNLQVSWTLGHKPK